MNFTDDSGEEIKYFSKTKIDQDKHLETVKLLQCLLANSLQGCLGMKQDLSFFLFCTSACTCSSGQERPDSGGFPHKKKFHGSGRFLS